MPAPGYPGSPGSQKPCIYPPGFAQDGWFRNERAVSFRAGVGVDYSNELASKCNADGWYMKYNPREFIDQIATGKVLAGSTDSNPGISVGYWSLTVWRTGECDYSARITIDLYPGTIGKSAFGWLSEYPANSFTDMCSTDAIEPAQFALYQLYSNYVFEFPLKMGDCRLPEEVFFSVYVGLTDIAGCPVIPNQLYGNGW